MIVLAQVLNPPPAAGGQELGTGAWLGFGGAILMVLGSVLSLTKVSLNVAVEGRDRRRRVAAVDHRPPPTETGAPVALERATAASPSGRARVELMASAEDVSFQLERFEWTADDTLEVVGRWNGLRPGRRMTRPA